jgi:hypothetical protein
LFANCRPISYTMNRHRLDEGELYSESRDSTCEYYLLSIDKYELYGDKCKLICRQNGNLTGEDSETLVDLLIYILIS